METIRKANKNDHETIMKIWESSVKETHIFLKETDFEVYKKIIPEKYLPNLDLYLLEDDKRAYGFIGAFENSLEMLFVDTRGKGFGKKLLEFAIKNLNITKLDVNEENNEALGFYKKFGFKIIGKSKKDAIGFDYPILHLELSKDTKYNEK